MKVVVAFSLMDFRPILVDGVLVVNEVVDLPNKMGCNLLVLKVDLEKAYDSVD